MARQVGGPVEILDPVIGAGGEQAGADHGVNRIADVASVAEPPVLKDFRRKEPEFRHGEFQDPAGQFRARHMPFQTAFFRPLHPAHGILNALGDEFVCQCRIMRVTAHDPVDGGFFLVIHEKPDLLSQNT